MASRCWLLLLVSWFATSLCAAEAPDEARGSLRELVARLRTLETLIDTIEESLAIADAGKAKRASAEKDLAQLEIDLRDTLAAARAPRPVTADTVGGAA